jgi:hypothetical protein
MNCQRCLPHFWGAWTVLSQICPDQATPESMERSGRLGPLLPYRKAAEVTAEFLPIEPTESFVSLRHRTLRLGERLDEKARQRAWFEPPAMGERRQNDLDLPNDPEREFVVSIDTAHVRASRTEAGKSFEIALARCGRGGRGARPGGYFTTADTSKGELQSRTMEALQSEGYAGRGEVTVLSDGAEIMRRLPRALPQPTAHIIDWFHIAMKNQPLQQVADHAVRWRRRFGPRRRRRPVVKVEALARASRSRLASPRDNDERLRDASGEGRSFRDAPAASGAAFADLRPIEPKLDHQLRRPLPIRSAHRLVSRRVQREFSHSQTDGQKAANAMVKARCPPSASGSKRRSLKGATQFFDLGHGQAGERGVRFAIDRQHNLVWRN